MPEEKIRLQKFMTQCGVASRRKSEVIILEQRVTVNDMPAELGQRIFPNSDVVKVDGKQIQQTNKNYYIMLNKPRGYLTSMKDDRGRKTVADLVKNIKTRVYPIGRLDLTSEGLLLMTNDGEFANAMMHPSSRIPKIYRVTVSPVIKNEQIEQLENGIDIDGKLTLPAQVKRIKSAEDRSVIEITIYEGRNRQIRYMCEAVGLKVRRLRRIAIGALTLGQLKPGQHRELNNEEIEYLKTLIINNREKE